MKRGGRRGGCSRRSGASGRSSGSSGGRRQREECQVLRSAVQCQSSLADQIGTDAHRRSPSMHSPTKATCPSGELASI